MRRAWTKARPSLGRDVFRLRAASTLLLAWMCGIGCKSTFKATPDGGDAAKPQAEAGTIEDAIPDVKTLPHVDVALPIEAAIPTDAESTVVETNQPIDVVIPADGPVPDSTIANPTCDIAMPFGSPIFVAGGVNDVGNNGAARLSPDELTMYFSSDRPASAGGLGFMDVYVAQRPQRAAAFGTAVNLIALNSASYEYDTTITGNGQTLYYGSNRLSVNRIYVSRWNVTTSSFGAPSLLDDVVRAPDGTISPTLTAYQPYILPDDSVLYMGSARLGNSDLFRSMKGTAGFSTPVAIAELNTTFDEFYPAVSSDDLVIYWASKRTDGGAKGGFDIWMASRASSGLPFTNLRNLQEINTTRDDEPSWISPDNCRLYLMNADPSGKLSIYVAERTR